MYFYKFIVSLISLTVVLMTLIASASALGKCLKFAGAVQYYPHEKGMDIFNECEECREAVIDWCGKTRKVKVPALGETLVKGPRCQYFILVTDRPCGTNKTKSTGILISPPSPKNSPKKENVKQARNEIVDIYDILKDQLESVGELADFRMLSAVREGDIDTIEALLDSGVDPDEEEVHGYKPLHFAAVKGDVKVLKILLAARADPNAKGDAYVIEKAKFLPLPSVTALHLAAFGGRVEVLEGLLAAGADPNIRDLYEMLPLHLAAARDDSGAIENLLLAGADPCPEDSYGHTPDVYVSIPVFQRNPTINLLLQCSFLIFLF